MCKGVDIYTKDSKNRGQSSMDTTKKINLWEEEFHRGRRDWNIRIN